jgi:hypothetical protein
MIAIMLEFRTYRRGISTESLRLESSFIPVAEALSVELAEITLALEVAVTTSLPAEFDTVTAS